MGSRSMKALSGSIAVLVPCYNEERTIAKVVAEFRASLPQARVYVYDNNSSDRTAEVAQTAGAVVSHVEAQGKGNVVRRMFADVEAEVYLLVDGDDTYDAESAPQLVERLLEERLDMVVATRLASFEQAAFRAGHEIGNRLLTRFVSVVFGRELEDVLSGYRVFSRRFVKSFPALAKGFETEVELTVHALELRMPIAEAETPYRARPEGSASKLRTYRDGLRIALMILNLFRKERPLSFFTIVFAVLALGSLGLAYPILLTYLETGLVPRFPTAILSTGIMLLAFLSLAAGFVLDTVTQGRHEVKRLFYLAMPAVGRQDPLG